MGKLVLFALPLILFSTSHNFLGNKVKSSALNVTASVSLCIMYYDYSGCVSCSCLLICPENLPLQ